MTVAYLKRDDIVLNKLIEMIVKGSYIEGQRLPSERELAKTLEVSRNRLREGIKGLEVMGVIEMKRGSGNYIKSIEPLNESTALWMSLNREKAYELHAVRCALELKAIELIPPQNFIKVGEQLKDCLARFDIDNCNGSDFIDHDINFHNIIRRASQNKALFGICEDISNTIYDERLVINKDKQRVKESIAEHKVIVDAFFTQNPLFIKQVCDAHFKSTEQYIMTI